MTGPVNHKLDAVPREPCAWGYTPRMFCVAWAAGFELVVSFVQHNDTSRMFCVARGAGPA